jgi:hypothetical protein
VQPVKIGIFSDAHGDIAARHAALAHLHEESALEVTGPRPRRRPRQRQKRPFIAPIGLRVCGMASL